MKHQKPLFFLIFLTFFCLSLPARAAEIGDLLSSVGLSGLFESEQTDITETTTIDDGTAIVTTKTTTSHQMDYGTLADLVTVYKKKRELQLWSNGKLLKTYRIALGFTPTGPKRQEGDGKTPEGIYLLTDHNENSNYYRSILVDYPSGADLVYAEKRKLKPGGAIMIHGLPNNGKEVNHPKRDWTDGCIAVTNEEMREIWNAVPPNTPIMIEP